MDAAQGNQRGAGNPDADGSKGPGPLAPIRAQETTAPSYQTRIQDCRSGPANPLQPMSFLDPPWPPQTTKGHALSRYSWLNARPRYGSCSFPHDDRLDIQARINDKL